MIGFQFKPILELLCPKNHAFLGVFSSDEIPLSMKIHSFFIFNTAESFETGRHWIIVWKEDRHSLECYDPLGSTSPYVLNKIGHLGRKLLYLSYPTQPKKSTLCGEYCIYFIVKRLFNVDQSFEECISELFSHNVEKNEKKVKIFIEQNFPTTYLDGPRS